MNIRLSRHSANKKNRQKGFTLVELIAVLVLMGVLAAMGSAGIVMVTRSFLIAHDTTAMTQKGQMAASRLIKELVECFDCSFNPVTATGNASFNGVIKTDFDFDNILGPRRIQISGGLLRIGERGGEMNVLADGVNSFNMYMCATTTQIDVPDCHDAGSPISAIRIEMQMTHQASGATIPFNSIFYPRNTE